jgi:hypothetical protein
MAQFPALEFLDTGLESEADVVANQIATELDLGIAPSLPAVSSGSGSGSGSTGAAGIPAAVTIAMEDNNALATSINAKLQKNMDMGNELAEALAASTVDSIKAAQTIALVEDNATLRKQNNNIAVFEATGGQAAQVDRAADAFAFELEREALLDKKADILDDEHTGIGIIDDVINGFRVINTEVALDNVTEQAAVNQQDIVNATAITQAAAQTNALVKQTSNQATIAANQKLIAAAGQKELYNATMVQNRSNADTLQSMLANKSQVLANTIAAFEIANSREDRDLAERKFQLSVRQDIRAQTRDRIAIRRSLVQEEREKIEAGISGRTATARERSILTSLEQQDIALTQSILSLSEDVATSEDRIAATFLARTQAETNLDISNLAFQQAQDDAENPEVAAAKKVERDAAALAFEAAKIAHQESQDQAGLRRASLEGSVEAQGIQNKIQELALESQNLLAEGKRADALAKLAESERLRVQEEVVRANDAENVREFQSMIFGAHAMEDPNVINDKLDNNNPAYMMMRQLSATAPVDAQGNKQLVLGSTPAKAMAFLNQLEASGIGVISNEITPVRILREVAAILQKADEDDPVTAANLTEAGLAIRFNKTAREYMEANEAETLWNDVTNPLQPLTIPQMIELSKGAGMAEQPLFRDVIIPKGNVDPNPDDVISSGIVAMQAGILSQEQVVEGVVTWGNSIAINNNINHHGTASIGLPHQTSVNMKVRRPRGVFASGLDKLSTTIDKAIIPAAVGTITGAGIAFAPTTGGLSLPAAGAFGSVVGGLAHHTGVGKGGIGLQGSDSITLNIADPISVRQYIISILSSSTLGGEDTTSVLDAFKKGE